MSGRITQSGEVRYIDEARNIFKQLIAIPNELVPRNTSVMQEGVVDAPITVQDLPLGSVTDAWFAIFVNLDPDNYIEIGHTVSAVFYPIIRLDPNKPTDVQGICRDMLPLAPGTTWQTRANTSPVEMSYTLFQRNS